MSQRRHTDKFDLDPVSVMELPPSHPAMRENRTLFPSTVVTVTRTEPERLLVSGKNNRKLGEFVEKGKFKGYAFYGLSLEERATCPIDCSVRGICYGSGMQLARRHRIGDADVFFQRIEEEIKYLLARHDGLLLRLHVLGDFPDPEYVGFWKDMLAENDKLAIYGYTARRTSRDGRDDIGDAIASLKDEQPERFRIRWSSLTPKADSATVIDFVPSKTKTVEGYACPAQTDATACCATCGLCWETAFAKSSILFVKHGRMSAGAAVNTIMNNALLDDDARHKATSRIQQLESAFSDLTWAPKDWGLSPLEVQALNVLMRRQWITRDQVASAISRPPADIEPALKSLRTKLLVVKVTVEMSPTLGYRISPACLPALDALQSGKAVKPLPVLGSALAAPIKPKVTASTRPITPIALPAKMVPAIITQDRPDIRMVRTSDLRVELAYQRDLSRKSITLIRKIIAEFSWAKFRMPICAEDEGEPTVLNVIEGQHTAIACASHPQLQMIPVAIAEADTVAKRAEAFIALNRDRVVMSPLQVFHAQIAGNDPQACDIFRIACETGVTIPRSVKNKTEYDNATVTAISKIERIYVIAGPAGLARMFRIIKLSGVTLVATTLIEGLRLLLCEGAFKATASLPDAEIARRIAAFVDIEKQATAFGASTGQNRYRAFARLVATNSTGGVVLEFKQAAE